MNGFERRKEQKKESIRQAAARLFLDNGIEKVTMQEIANKANVSHVTIFKYFTSKQDLIKEVVRWWYEQEYRELEGTLKGRQPYLQRLKEIMFLKRKVFDLVDLDSYRQASAINPTAVADIISFYQEKKNALYQEFINEGKERGYVRPEVPAEALVMINEGLRALVKLRPEILIELKYNKTLLEGYIRILLFGIMEKQEISEEFDHLIHPEKSTAGPS